MTITTRKLAESAKDWFHASTRWSEVTNRVAERGQEHADQAADIGRGLRLVAWLLRHGHKPADAVRALNSVGFRAQHGRRWTEARLRNAVAVSPAVVERANQDHDSSSDKEQAHGGETTSQDCQPVEGVNQDEEGHGGGDTSEDQQALGQGNGRTQEASHGTGDAPEGGGDHSGRASRVRVEAR